MILDERGFNGFVEWSDRVSFLLDKYGDAPTIAADEQWPDWAAAVCQIGAVAAQNPPSPVTFNDWRSWVQAFNQTITLNV